VKLTPHIPDRHRRRLIGSAAVALLVPGLLRAQDPSSGSGQAGALRTTPAMTEGPFYPDVLPADRDADLAAVKGRTGAAEGRLLYVSGRVLDARGRPMPNARIELWQANAHGRYIHSRDSDTSGPLDPNFQGYGVLAADAEGRYRIRTVQPGPYPGRTRHLHFNFAGGKARLTTQMFFEGERGNEEDGVYRALAADERRAATGRYVDRSPGMEAQALAVSWDVVLRA
jgi:protocatechuate 3,4-dioxygenase beta subunit